MIYITLGTQPCDFSRCLTMIEDLLATYTIDEPIIAQIGHTHYVSEEINCFDFISEEQYQQYMDSARVVISHAGTGALFGAIKKRKKVIAVARLAKYGEMINDHQTEIVKKLAGEGYILDGTYSVTKAWEKLDTFVPRQSDFYNNIPQDIELVLSGWGIEKNNIL